MCASAHQKRNPGLLIRWRQFVACHYAALGAYHFVAGIPERRYRRKMLPMLAPFVDHLTDSLAGDFEQGREVALAPPLEGALALGEVPSEKGLEDVLLALRSCPLPMTATCRVIRSTLAQASGGASSFFATASIAFAGSDSTSGKRSQGA